MKWQVLQEATDIPQEWDALADDNIFLRKNFLLHLERENPCQQSYNLCFVKNSLKAIYVDYQLKLDAFTYSVLNFRIPVKILGIPCSVSKQGYIVKSGYERHLTGHFFSKNGAKLILNSGQNFPLRAGHTLPSCRLTIEWTSFSQYLKALRSHYRYRINKALEKREKLQIRFSSPATLEYSLYNCYEEVYRNSPYQLEKLPFDFFTGIPLPAVIIEAAAKDKKLGFALLVEDGEELIFMFIGFNHSLNLQYDIYLNLLLEIIRYGIDNKFKVIEMGQTAEETKLKLGGQLLNKYMYINHSNPLINILANRFIKLLGYRMPNYNYHVFHKGDKDESTSNPHQT